MVDAGRCEASSGAFSHDVGTTLTKRLKLPSLRGPKRGRDEQIEPQLKKSEADAARLDRLLERPSDVASSISGTVRPEEEL